MSKVNNTDYLPYKRNEKFVREWAIPGMSGFEHRVGGLEKENLTLKNAIFASTAPELFEFLNLQKINSIIDNVKFNIWSGDCHNYILLAQGKIDLVIEENLNSWDILPLIPILKSREISITDWSGSEILFDFKTKKKFKVIAACNKDLLNEVLQFLN